MIDLIVLIILLISFLGMAVILLRKVPVLVELSPHKVGGPGILEKIAKKATSNGFIKNLSPEILLHKALSNLRALTVKTESKTADWLKDLREKSDEKRKSFSEDYWKKVKKK